MVKINLPPGCNGFADGDKKYLSRKPGGSVNLDPDKDAGALRKLKNQDYASAGLVDAGPEKQFIEKGRTPGMWCRQCNFLGHAWMKECNKCGGLTVSEDEMDMHLPEGPYMI
jgi:hypothetical protein